MSGEASLRADIVEVGRRMYARRYTASNDGNISVRLGAGRLLMTPKSVCKGFMTPEMMCVTDLEGRKLQGERDPSSEMLMHLEVYRQRPDIQAVVHAHPPIATGFAVAGIPLDRAVLAEVLTTLGSIPIAAYATPSTAELPEAVRKYIKAHDGMLLANHGALTVGSDLFSAYYKMETIEHFATISLVARLLGRENLIAREEVLRLQDLRGTYGITAPAPICADPAEGGATRDASGVGGSRDASAVGGSRDAGAVGGSRDASAVGRSRDASVVGASGDASAGDDPATCQFVQAPSGNGRRLVPGSPDAARAAAGQNGEDAEIRLTYRQLSALIEDAIRSLR
jgi:L-fuculose-phosphate aldolase